MSTTTSTTSTTTATDSASIGSALLTSIGGGTGLDMTNLATQIAAAEYASQNASLTSQLSKVAVQISQASQLKSDLLSLSSSLGTLVEGTNLLPQPTIANSAVASATLPSGSAGSPSSYSLEVTKLAAPQVVTTGNLPASSKMKGGTLTFDFGTISNGALSPSGTSKSITIADGATMAQVATAINSASMGVTAYVATNANGQQLVIKGSEGAAKGFTITGSDSASASASNTSLTALAYDPAATNGQATLIASASDAAYKLDGISRTSASNTIDYAAPGLSLKLTGTNTGSPTTITYSDPSSSLKSTMSNLVTALNSIITEVNTDTNASSGNLYSDSAAKATKRAFSALPNTVIMPNAATGEPKTLADLGVKITKDGSLTLDSAKLSAALASNPSAVAAMFTSGINGIYSTVFNTVNTLTTSTNSGSLAGSITQYTDLQTRLTTKQSKLTDLQTQLRTRLVNQYAAANSSVANSNSTLTYLKNQVAAWNKTG
jgi:flagellar hook-associated protein 2